jgi:hypothetical protein
VDALSGWCSAAFIGIPLTRSCVMGIARPDERADNIAEHTVGQTAIATVPEAATDTPGMPTPQTTGQAHTYPRKMGAEMDSAGDQRASRRRTVDATNPEAVRRLAARRASRSFQS